MLIHRFLLVALSAWTPLSYASPVTEVPHPMITAAPQELRKREPYGNGDFIGYYAVSGVLTYISTTCAGLSYREYSTSGYWFGGCQLASTRSIYTTCISNTVFGISIYSSDSTSTTSTTVSYCGSSSTCISDILLYTPGATTSWFIQCAASRAPYTFYRTYSSLLPNLVIPPTVTSIPPARTVTVTPTITPTSTPTSAPSKVPVGAIVGGTVGGVAFLTLLVVAILIFLKKRQRQPAPHGHNQPVLVPQGAYAPGYQGPPYGYAPEGEKIALSPVSNSSPTSPATYGQQWSGANPHMGSGISASSPPPPNYAGTPVSSHQPFYPPQQQVQHPHNSMNFP